VSCLNVPMVDLHRQYLHLKAEIDAAIHGVLDSTQFVLGPEVEAFEQEAAAYLGTRFAVSCASGTDALTLSLRAVDIGPGDEVITTPFTFVATAEAIRHVGAVPVFVDIDPDTFNLTAEGIQRALSPRTRAVIPVHLFGQPVDMEPLMRLAGARGLAVIEDCAQAFGAHVHGRRVGSFGTTGAFSFFPSKNLGAYGDGGLVATDDAALAERLRSLRNHGTAAPYTHTEVGFNSRLDAMQAAVLRVKLRHIERFNARRRAVADRYDAALAHLPVTRPARRTGHHVFHQYTILTERRDALREALREAGVASAVYYPVPLHRQPVFESFCRDVHLPNAEAVAERCLSLPIYPELAPETVDRICEVVAQAL